MSEKVVYTGHFVQDPAGLLEKLPPAINDEGSTVHAHHVTQDFEPADGVSGIVLGRERTLHITGQVVADGVHAAIVESPDGEQISSNEHPHITIATAKGVPAVKSNEVIARAVQEGTTLPINPPIQVKTTEGFFDGKQVHTQ